MKKFFIACAIALGFASTASAEKYYIGGELGYWHESAGQNGGSTNQLTILPEFGINLSDHWAVGAVAGYDYTHLCGQGASNNIFQVKPYVRYTYFKSDNNFVNLFVDGGVGIGAGWASYDGDDSDTSVIYNIGLRPGISLNFNDKFSFVAHVGFLGYEGANDTAKEFGYNNKGGLLLNNNNLSFGFYYNF